MGLEVGHRIKYSRQELTSISSTFKKTKAIIAVTIHWVIHLLSNE